MIQKSDALQQVIDRTIADLLPLSEHPKELYDPIRYILEDGGKRMRPLLCLLACNVYSDEPAKALAPAVAVEVFHNFTLLHDDIMDQAAIRRGRPTVHKQWSESGAILSGDAMLILSYQILCGERIPSDPATLRDQLQVFNRVSMEVCQGQQYDMEFENRTGAKVTREEYLEMIRLKTAVLMAAGLELGAIAGGATAKQRKAVYEFGINLGLAFQIQDDLLDTYGDTTTFGKMIGGDIAVGKKTFLHIAAMERATPEEQQEILREGELDEKLPRVRAIYDKLGVRETAEEAIATYFGKGLEILRTIHADPARIAELEQYSYSLMKRTK